MASDRELAGAIEIVRDRLYWVALRAHPRPRADAHFFTIDDRLVYWNFFLDFGPLNLGQTMRFCQILNNKLRSKEHANKRIYFYSSTHQHKRTNAAYLIAAYSLLYLGRSPEEACKPFDGIRPPFPYFHDASPLVCTYKLSILDCIRGMHRAVQDGFFSLDTFNLEEYEYYEKVENGDLNWLAHGLFVAFAGPHDVRSSTPEGYHTLCPEDYTDYFLKRNVSLVIRLNKKYYNEKRFTNVGINHLDLYYLDGSNPPRSILEKFIASCEKAKGAIAVHCKAGLGRTGTCIGAYIMKHYRWTAAEIIGWFRICRPGSIIGPQQHFMKEIEPRMWALGDAYRKKAKAAAAASAARKNGGAGGSGAAGAAAGAGGRAGVSSSSATSSSRTSSYRRDASASKAATARYSTLGRSGAYATTSSSTLSKAGGAVSSSGYGTRNGGGRYASPSSRKPSAPTYGTSHRSGASPSTSGARLGLARATQSRTSGGASGSSGRYRSPTLRAALSPGSVASDASQGDELRAARARRTGGRSTKASSSSSSRYSSTRSRRK